MIKFLSNLFSRNIPIHPIDLSRLEFAFTDSNGIKYYKFPENLSLPIERFGQLNKYMMWMVRGLCGDELKEMIDDCDKYLADGLLQKKNAAKIGYILTQMRERENMVIHTEILYNFIAVQLVREGEPVEFFNNKIHLEKIDAFKDECKKGKTYDFFLRIGLKKLSDMYNMSEEEWNTLWQESELKQEALKRMLHDMRSETP